MEPLEKTTIILSGSSYPTIADVRYFFNEIKAHLKHCTQKDGFGQYMLADSINYKIEEYWTIIDDATTIASLLDPRNKSSVFEIGEEIGKLENYFKRRIQVSEKSFERKLQLTN